MNSQCCQSCLQQDKLSQMGICSQKELADDRPRHNAPKSAMTLEQRITASKFRHRLYQMCQRVGHFRSEQVAEWIQQTFRDNYHSSTTMLDGTKSQRSKTDLPQVYDKAADAGWQASVFLVSGVFEKQGKQEWIAWIYKILVPHQGQYLEFLYSAISIFDINSGKWESSEYTQMQRPH